jgi:photosystem II stability/assembly factor-like uncharacterized protein
MHLSRARSRSVIRTAMAFAVAGLLAVPAAANAAPRGISLHLYDASFCTTTVGWAVGAQAAIVKTTDGGRHWVRQAKSLPPDRGSFTSVAAVSAKECWAVGTFGVYKTGDGGKTWNRVARQPRPTALESNTWCSVVTVGSKVVWLSSTDGDIAKSIDAGKTWSRQLTARSGVDGVGAIACNGSKNAWLPIDSVSTVYGRGVLVTADGASWTPVLSDLWYYGSAELVAACSSSTTTVWLGRGDGTVYTSGDGGTSWEVATPDGGPGAFGLAAIDSVGATVCAVGTAWGGTPWRAAGIVNNGGGWSWMTFQTKSGAPAPAIGDVDMLTAKVGLALAGAGQVFKTVDGGASWQQQ